MKMLWFSKLTHEEDQITKEKININCVNGFDYIFKL